MTIVPGSLHLPRTVLEWRVDPESGWSNRHAVETERRLILLCAHGWSSSLAAATLVDLGYRAAGDVEGGFEAWLAFSPADCLRGRASDRCPAREWHPPTDRSFSRWLYLGDRLGLTD